MSIVPWCKDVWRDPWNIGSEVELLGAEHVQGGVDFPCSSESQRLKLTLSIPGYCSPERPGWITASSSGALMPTAEFAWREVPNKEGGRTLTLVAASLNPLNSFTWLFV